MNSAQRFELRDIRESQDRLHHLIDNLDRRIEVLAKSLVEPAETPAPKLQVHPDPVPPAEAKPPVYEIEEIPALPPPLPAAPTSVESAPRPSSREEANYPAFPQFVPPAPRSEAPETSDGESLELRVGSFWLARIGIVILLTGLVFLGNYAYHRIVPLLGPWGKVSLLMMAGLGLSGAGYWMEKGKESLRNFGRVLFAGGAAAIYYTTYAAHYVTGLRVIESPLMGGMLLLCVAGGIAWYAERKRSETIASLAILLSYYTSAINAIAGFTLFSSLLLTAVAVYFLIRHQWVRLSALSLVATYGSYAFWRFHQVVQFGPGGDFGMGLSFLAGYWVLFTSAVVFASIRPADRVAFLTANNVALFAFAAHHFAVHLPDAFWMFAIGFGGTLLGLAALAAYRDPENATVDGAYLAQGLIAITVGFAAKFSGPQLTIVLALESAALLTSSRRRHALICEIGAGICALGSFVLGVESIRLGGSRPWSVGLPVAVLLLFNGWWIKRLRGELKERMISGRTLAFAALGLILVGCVVWETTSDAWKPVVFALVPILGLAAFRISLAEVGMAAQVFVFVAVGLVFSRIGGGDPAYPWWTPVSVIASAIALLHWWQFRRDESWADVSNPVQLIFAAATVGVGLCWMESFVSGDEWLIATSVAAVGTLVYGLATRAWTVGLIGQLFSVLSVGTFVMRLALGHPTWHWAFVPVASVAVLAALIARFGPSRWPALPAGNSYAEISQGYRLAGAVLFAVWAFEYVPLEWRVVFFAAGGALQIVLGSWQHSKARIISGAIYAVAGSVLFWMRLSQPVEWVDLLALIAIPLSLRVSAHLNKDAVLPKEIRDAIVTLVLVNVWLWVTNWATDRDAIGQLTSAWTILAMVVLGAGLSLRERIYRLGGFAILGLAVGRLFVFDVWKFDSFYRIVSFIVLGAALLALSFVYNRFAETLRKFL